LPACRQAGRQAGRILSEAKMLAVIKTGGKQYLVEPGQKIKIEKIDEKEGKEIAFSEVLLVEKNKKLEIGTPFIKGAKVLAKVLKQGKGEKVIAFKYKSKTRQKTKKGHRQLFTELEIKKIVEE
jgi:large subunit ribosomal protein L21